MHDLVALRSLLTAPLGDVPEVVAPPLVCTLWSFKSRAWNGFVDFRGAPKYQTHWGWGTWHLVRPRGVLLVNDYDGYRHALAFDEGWTRYVGLRSDGMKCEGELLYDYANQRR